MATTEQTSCLIDDFSPLPVLQPGSVDEVGEVVRRAAAEGQALYPLGGRTMLALGHTPTRSGWGVDVRGLAKVIDYPARDMTITVQAGLSVARLQAMLAAESQRLPIDVPQPERATVGGMLAVNASGPHRYGFGTLRDYVLGLSTVNDEGQEVKAGGRVVKNVAGYDLAKLHLGALGTLGILTQVTLKVRPVPETRAILTLGCPANELAGQLDLLHRSRARPVCFDLLNAAAARTLEVETGAALPASPWVVLAAFEDQEATVRWQVQQLIKEIVTADVQGVEACAGAATAGLAQGLSELTWRPAAQLSFKANLLPSMVADFCRRAEALAEGVLLLAHAGSGIVHGHLDGLTAERAAAILKELLELAVQARGNLIVPHAPPAWKKVLPLWGQPRNDGWLMRQIKDKLDPRRLFNPGRFAEEI